MSEEIALASRKGQVTIPASKRKGYDIREGTRVLVKETGEGVLIKPVIPIEDLAGIDAGKVSLEEMRRKLDDMRREKRFV